MNNQNNKSSLKTFIKQKNDFENKIDHPHFCINMIVKNESRVIEKMLLQIVENINRNNINDTNSTNE